MLIPSFQIFVMHHPELDFQRTNVMQTSAICFSVKITQFQVTSKGFWFGHFRALGAGAGVGGQGKQVGTFWGLLQLAFWS